jgi:hypothetical protein
MAPNVYSSCSRWTSLWIVGLRIVWIWWEETPPAGGT